jgi:hypothetical protein
MSATVEGGDEFMVLKELVLEREEGARRFENSASGKGGWRIL